MEIVKYWVIDDSHSKQREAFVCNCDELSSLSYGGYYTVATFNSYAEAAEFCNLWNDGADPRFIGITINGVAIKDIDTIIELVNGDTIRI